MRYSFWKRILVGAGIITLLGSSCSTSLPAISPSPSMPQTLTTDYTHPITVGTTTLRVEIAATTESRKQGLSGREPLTDEQGMLFDFRGTGSMRPNFWMKDMKFNLDILWIKDFKIVDITKNVLAPNPGQTELPSYSPKADTDMVLEVLAGWSDRHNINIGDPVVLRE